MTRKTWRCFHCDELFTSAAKARAHFGYDNHSTPACFIVGAAGSLIEKLREAEKDVDDAWFAIQEETLECHKAMRSQAARYQTAIAAAEELGYERGLRDGRAEAAPKPVQKAQPRQTVNDSLTILRRLADGDTIVYSQDGDMGWFTKGDRAFVGDEIMTLRACGYIKREIDPTDETDNYRGMAEYDTISDAGRKYLKEQSR